MIFTVEGVIPESPHPKRSGDFSAAHRAKWD